MIQEAVIKVSPDIDETVVALHTEALRLLAFARIRVIASDADVKDTTNDLSIITGVKKAVEAKRVEYVGPINDHLKAVNNAFKAFTEPLIEADRLLRGKVLEYREAQRRAIAEQERINQLRMEAARAEMELKGELTEPVEMVEIQPEQPDRYKAEAGTLGKARIVKWEVADFAQIPDEYKIVDASKVGRVVRAGLRNIPGIKIWEEESLRVTTPKGE